jgi:hypothetical protein
LLQLTVVGRVSTMFTVVRRSVVCLVLLGCADSGTGEGGAGGTGASDGVALPCDVADIVQARCASCHGNPPSSSAPQSLLTVAEWKAPSPTYPELSNGELSVERMKNALRPMPPSGLVAAEELAVIEAWVNGGMQGGECEPQTVEDPILNADPVCTSMDFWPAGEDEKPGKTREEMFPGMPCLDCHQNPAKYNMDEGADEVFSIAGTIFPSGHEPDLCAGLDGDSVTDVLIRIEDANGNVFDLKPNAAGNFLRKASVAMPYAAKVVSASGERAMSYKPSTGDCNLCHTAEGSNGGDPNSAVAPGRIVVPLAP